MKNYKDLKLVYEILYSYYGPQGWWPVTNDGFYPTYRKNYFGPLTESECFEIVVGCILTQNASWRNVEKCIINLKKGNLLTPKKILNLSSNVFEDLIRPSIYYRQKSARLKDLCRWIISHGGKIKDILKGDPIALRGELLSIKGIGKETADSILLYAGYHPFFVIDAYTKRLFMRLYNREISDYDTLQEIFHSSLDRDFKIYNEFHALIVEHSKKFCRKIPSCTGCPLIKLCHKGEGDGDNR